MNYYQITAASGEVYQNVTCASYSDKENTYSKSRDMATYNMPMIVGQNLTEYNNLDTETNITFDLQSGYALGFNSFRSHFLVINGYFAYFFNPMKSDTFELVSSYNHTVAVNVTTFVGLIYPGNGTV